MLLAKELGAQRLLAKGDSLLVTGKVTGEYKAKDPQLASYLRYVKILRAAFSAFDLIHVPREQNSRAYLLSKLASSGKGGWQRSVIQQTLKSPRTTARGLFEVDHLKVWQISPEKGSRHRSVIQETLKAPRITIHELPKHERFEVMQINTTDTWLTPYRRYLVDGLLPSKPTEAKIIKRNIGQYTLIDGHLFRDGYTHPLLTCVSGYQCTQIMFELHKGICGSHIDGRALSLKLIRVGYYWPTMIMGNMSSGVNNV
ncbi:uncharacterized protein [Phaseolus vulgaris]|uniref:uncharacterized protein n=1 Tax=Phaseolus vulgaris TaxID=3885 RepID=UPI0035C9ACC1